MDCLELKYIRDEDRDIFGDSIIKLARLEKAGLPVVSSVGISPPTDQIVKILQKLQIHTSQDVENKSGYFKKELFLIKPPPTLVKILKAHKISINTVWPLALDTWFSQLQSAIFRQDTVSFLAQLIILPKKNDFSGWVYFDYNLGQLVILSENKNELEEFSPQIEKLVKRADQKLFMHHQYFVIYDGLLKIGKVSVLTDVINYNFKEEACLIPDSKEPDIKKVNKNALKLFLDISTVLHYENNHDGLLLMGESILNHELGLSLFDTKVWKLVETASKFPQLPVLYKLADIKKQSESIRGSDYLLASKKLLAEEASIILFARNKKQLLNVSVVLPFVRSVEEFLRIKRELATMGVTRKGSFKIWLEMAVPENFINLDDYMKAEFDGAVINTDELLFLLTGGTGIILDNTIQTMMTFLKNAIQRLNKANIPILVYGKVAFHDDLLRFFIDHGIWGIIMDLGNIRGINEYISNLEKIRFKKITS